MKYFPIGLGVILLLSPLLEYKTLTKIATWSEVKASIIEIHLDEQYSNSRYGVSVVNNYSVLVAYTISGSSFTETLNFETKNTIIDPEYISIRVNPENPTEIGHDLELSAWIFISFYLGIVLVTLSIVFLVYDYVKKRSFEKVFGKVKK